MRSCSRLILLLTLAVSLAGPAHAQHSLRGTGDLDPAIGSELDGTSLRLLAGAGLLAALAKVGENDDHLQRMIDRSGLEGAIDLADQYGEGQYMGFAALGLVAAGHRFHLPRARRAGEELAVSLVGAWAVTWALKIGVNAERPNGGAYSFPSGHTATAFAAAPVVTRNFGRVAGVAAYSVATLTAMARLEDARHHLADVIVGAGIGIVAGRTFTEHEHLSWIVSRSGTGIGLSLRF